MKQNKPFLRRRQFLIGSVASATTLAFTRLVRGKNNAIGSDSNASDSIVSDVPENERMDRTKRKYSHLLSPLKIRNRLVKNRILYSISTPHLLQGPENFPSDIVRSYYSNIAKNAAIVMFRAPYGPQDGPGKHWAEWDPDFDSGAHNYIDQMIEGIHCEGTLVGGAHIAQGKRSPGGPPESVEIVKIEDVITQAKQIEDKGYDMAYVGYRGAKNREELKPIIEQMEAVRKTTNLIVVAWIQPLIPGVSWGPEGEMMEGPSVREVVEMVKMLEGIADIIQMKDAGSITNHPNSFNQEQGQPLMLSVAKAIKESGSKIITAPNGGFRNPALNDEFIASGKTDMIAMARPLICDPEYVKKASEGRGEDWVPCVMCNKCHMTSYTDGPWISVCSVNPKLGLSSSVKSIQVPSASKKVAVIGGGPAGMKAAVTAAERGHKVTLYEKGDSLGGLLRHTDFTPYKWAYKDFKDHLVLQTYKAGVEVLLGVEVTPEMIRTKGYDTVLVALGAEPIIPRIPGVDSGNVWNIVDAYGNIKSLGEKVVIIGGGDIGTETGICLAKAGHKTTAITSEEKMIMDIGGPHNKDAVIEMYQNMDNFSYIVQATATRIADGKVTYRNAKGSKKSIRADSVVIYAGLRPRMDEAMKFSGSAKQVLLVGDCAGKAGNVQKTIRSAFFMASQV